MKTLDRYILFKYLKAFVFSMVIIDLIILVIDYTEKNAKYRAKNLSWAEIGAYYIDYMPWVTNFAIPLMSFIAVVFVTSRLAGHTEIIAMLSNGMSFRRLMWPYVLGASMVAVVNFYMIGWVIPDSNKDRVAFEVANLERAYYFNDKNVHLKIASDPDTYFYFETYSNRTQIGYKVSLETVEDYKLLEKLTGTRIEWNEEEESWRIKNYQVRTFNEMGETMAYGTELDTVLNISPDDFENDYRRFETLTLDELNDYMETLQSRGVEGLEEYKVEKALRYAAPFYIIVLSFIGVLVSSRKVRGGTGAMIALGFAIALVFSIFYVMSRSLAVSGDLPIQVAAWLPNALFGAIGLYMYSRVSR